MREPTQSELDQLREAFWATVRFVNRLPAEPQELRPQDFPLDKVNQALYLLDRLDTA